jgi:hypothetical protein
MVTPNFSPSQSEISSRIKLATAYAESPSEQEIVSALDTRLRGYDGRAVTFCHTREGGYPEFKTQLGLSR